MWEDLAEVRTLAASDAWRGKGVGHLLVERLLEEARALGVSRVFCLTFEVDFFKKHGFAPVFVETAGGHTWINWRHYLADFAPMLFQARATAPNNLRIQGK